MLKKKLNYVLEHGKLPLSRPQVTQEQIDASNEMRQKVQDRMRLPLSQFLSTKVPFDAKHGMVYKILKTSPQRLRDSTLCSHDVAFWLKDHKHPTAAAWVLKLAGPQVGQVSRNQILQWLKDRNEQQTFYRWTRKWGFEDTAVTKTIMASPSSVSEARGQYKEFKGDKQVFGNKLLHTLSHSQNIDADEFYAFFRMLPKDVITFQIMLSSMVRHLELRQFLDSVWELAEKQERNNNIKIDDKLRETHTRVAKLAASHNRQSTKAKS